MAHHSKFAAPPDSADKAREIFERYLQQKGLRLTPQRRFILDYFLQAEWHLSAEELYQRIRKLDPNIGYSTVYRTLKLLGDCHLARELPLGDERLHFEPMYKVQHHDHLICKGCGKIMEFYRQQIEDLQQEICRQYKFTPTHHNHEIYGFCSSCKS